MRIPLSTTTTGRWGLHEAIEQSTLGGPWEGTLLDGTAGTPSALTLAGQPPRSLSFPLLIRCVGVPDADTKGLRFAPKAGRIVDLVDCAGPTFPRFFKEMSRSC